MSGLDTAEHARPARIRHPTHTQGPNLAAAQRLDEGTDAGTAPHEHAMHPRQFEPGAGEHAGRRHTVDQQTDGDRILVAPQKAQRAVDRVDRPDPRAAAPAMVDGGQDLVFADGSLQRRCHPGDHLLGERRTRRHEIGRPLFGEHGVVGKRGGDGVEQHRLRTEVGDRHRLPLVLLDAIESTVDDVGAKTSGAAGRGARHLEFMMKGRIHGNRP